MCFLLLFFFLFLFSGIGINSGVMLMNLTRLRDSNFTSWIQEYYRMYAKKISFGDQCLLNIYFHFHSRKLHIHKNGAYILVIVLFQHSISYKIAVCTQRRLRSASASAHSDQILRSSLSPLKCFGPRLPIEYLAMIDQTARMLGAPAILSGNVCPGSFHFGVNPL